MTNNKYLFEKLAKLVYNSGWDFDVIIYLDSISCTSDYDIFSKLFDKPFFSEKELDTEICNEIKGKVLLFGYIVNKYEHIKKNHEKSMKKIKKNMLISEIRSAVIWNDDSGKYIMFGNIPNGPLCGEKI